ncbi:hypothetical protein L1987_84158 [Smallanthus sonchifolius]|uniref:Uncharacterized protein n=1 Tax=Smallanthus sonchifolius TaxID=185202 RepID=A0ACB8YEL4_9ASTR|nr:hypothetical protein L1987_84158 [Smallanthus sonchifolius]
MNYTPRMVLYVAYSSYHQVFDAAEKPISSNSGLQQIRMSAAELSISRGTTIRSKQAYPQQLVGQQQNCGVRSSFT